MYRPIPDLVHLHLSSWLDRTRLFTLIIGSALCLAQLYAKKNH